jgi:hypothetical protein
MTEETKVKKPARLDIVDLPRDKDRVLGSIRQGLCASFNYCRRYRGKLEVLGSTLAFILDKIEVELEYQSTVDAEKAQAQAQAKEKAQEAAKSAAEEAKPEAVQTPASEPKTAPVKVKTPSGALPKGAKASNNPIDLENDGVIYEEDDMDAGEAV